MQYPAPEQLLAAWQEYDLPFTEQPSLVKRFISVGNNQSFLVAADNAKWVVRINREASLLGVNRERELLIHRRVAERGIAPAIKYYSGDILITRYVVGQSFSPARINPELSRTLIEQTKKVHQIDIELPDFDYRKQFSLLDPAEALSQELDDAIELMESCGKRVLCHHDLSPENILLTHNGAIFIDWEYAAFGIDAMDFATLVCDCEIPAATVISHTELAADTLEAACRVYRALCEKWSTKKSI